MKINEFQHMRILELEMQLNLKGYLKDDLEKIFKASKDPDQYEESLKEELEKKGDA